MKNIEGYAVLWNKIDCAYDIFADNAFIIKDDYNIPLLLHHDPYKRIGTLCLVKQNDKGLWIRSTLNFDVPDSCSGLSVGFKTLKGRRGTDGVRTIERAELWEVSVVYLPCQELSRFNYVL